MLLRERGIELAILSGTFCAPIVPFPPHSLLGLPPVCLIQVAAAATTAPRRQSSGIMRRFGCLVELFLHRRYFVLISSIIILTPSSPHKSRLPFQMSHINMVVMKSNYHCIGMLMFNAVFLYFVSKITEITEITSTN